MSQSQRSTEQSTEPDTTCLNVVLDKGTARLRYAIEPCGKGEWLATIDDLTGGRNLYAVRLTTPNTVRSTHAEFNRAIDLAVRFGHWKTVSVDNGREAARRLNDATTTFR